MYERRNASHFFLTLVIFFKTTLKNRFFYKIVFLSIVELSGMMKMIQILCSGAGSVKNNLRKVILLSSLLLSALTSAQAPLASDPSLQLIAQQLAGAKLKQVAAILDELEVKSGEAVLPLFDALANGKLYYQKSDKRLVFISVLKDKAIQAKGVFDDKH
jgi:hypothetical protein